MEIQVVELGPDVVGKRLGQNMYSPKGSLLLRRGAEIKPTHFAHLKEMGYRSVYLLESGQEDAFDSDGLLISEELRARAPVMLREIFRKLLSPKRPEMIQGKRELNQLAEQLLAEMNYRAKGRFYYLDLKRRDDYLYQHALDVATYALLMGHSLQYHQLKLMSLVSGALLHDIGKLLIDEAIVNKTTPLDEQETRLLREHTVKGFQHLGRACQFDGLITIVALQHHERFDGNGYPKGLSGHEIHEFSRIVALANFFDEYTSDLPHRRMHSIAEAAERMKAEAGSAFDPELVPHFLAFIE